MRKSLTIVYTTMRENPRFQWFMDSLRHQVLTEFVKIDIVVVTRKKISEMNTPWFIRPIFIHPKPTVWQGEHRLTKEDWFAASNARNTGLCVAKTDWIAFVDDLSVLMPTWFKAVREAMEQNYIVCGSYRKVKKIVVEHGIVKSFEHSPNGVDTRRDQVKENVTPCSGGWLYGCSCAMPIDALLKIGGWNEMCDGMGQEDCATGFMLQNAGYTLKYDTRMLSYESEEAHFEEPPMKKTDKGVSPNDKSHAIMKIVHDGLKYFDNFYDGGIAAERQKFQRDYQFTVRTTPTRDWFDKQKISEM